FFGETLRERRAGAVHVFESAYAHGTALAAHAHASAHAALVLAGEVEEKGHGRALACKPLALLVRRAGDEHANRFRGPTRCLTIEASEVERFEPRAFADGGPAIIAAVQLVRALRDTDEPLEVESLALEVLASAAPATPSSARTASWLRRV